ncbi:MAG: GerW family sporulation protein [Lachnospiraceae bacterium]|nr:GerW family sporulation protein [Lachnospiraceae bacterium]
MGERRFNEVVESLLKGMDGFLSSKTVVGEAVKIGDTIIIPFVDVSFGVGAGEFRGEKKDNGAGGLTGKMAPSAVLVIANGTTRLVNIKNQDSVTKILDMVPDLVNHFAAKKESKDGPSDEEIMDVAFPDGE